MATAERSAPGPTTVEELDRWAGDPGEIIDGVWVPKYPDGKVTGASFAHGVVVIRIARLLADAVEPRRLGVIGGAESAFLLRRDPDLVRCADVAFVSAARLTSGIQPGAARMAPDLAVEVRSPSDRNAKVAQKIKHYLQHGTRVVWDVDPEARTVVVHRPDALPAHLGGDDLLDGGDVLPGFAVPTAALFADLDLFP